MYSVRQLDDDTWYVGGSDRRLALFESAFPIPRGISYNSYLVMDDETVLLDTVDASVAPRFFENIEHVLSGRALNYLIINHMEPDHCSQIEEVCRRWPGCRLVCGSKALEMLKQFFTFDAASRAIIVGEGDTLETGRHVFTFAFAPMVHWPEVMVTYDGFSKTLFSADAFGTFGALSGNLYADEVDFAADWLPDARRYYTNIVGKYGTQVQALLKKATKLDIARICPLHGPIWRKNLGWFIEKYYRWATCTPEDDAVLIAYASVYGDTANAADIIADRLGELGVRNIALYDVSTVHPSLIVAEAFRCSHIVLAATTYNAGIFISMETALLDLKAHALKNRTVAIVENGTWAPASGSLMKGIIMSMRGMTVLEGEVSLRSSVKQADREALTALADSVYASMPKPAPADHTQSVEPGALFRLSYGLFVLTSRDNGRDNGCIINTAAQVTDSPKRISITVNKANLTHDAIMNTGVFNISVISQDAQFALFRRFGFVSGRTADKFAGYGEEERSQNGLYYIGSQTNAFISCRVVKTEDLGTHTVFFADVTEAKTLSRTPSATYQFYFDNIKPKPAPAAEEKKKGFVCKICGYVYEGETLPPDFICPICKHGAEAFEPIV